jgi:hypothetical protein
MSLCIPSNSRSLNHDPHRTIYYIVYPLGRFAGLKHRHRRRHEQKGDREERVDWTGQTTVEGV